MPEDAEGVAVDADAVAFPLPEDSDVEGVAVDADAAFFPFEVLGTTMYLNWKPLW